MDESLYELREQEYKDRAEANRELDEDDTPIPLESTPITDEFLRAEDHDTGVGEAAFDGEN